MIIKSNQNEELLQSRDAVLVVWEDSFATEIPMLDDQHRELINLTNQLYRACLTGNDAVESAFQQAMTRMVEYVRFHFSAELKLLHKIKYPQYGDHKVQHDSLIKQILEAANEYKSGRRFVPHNFVRTLKDWVFGHIAVYDRAYAAYIRDLKNRGLLTDQQINELS